MTIKLTITGGPEENRKNIRRTLLDALRLNSVSEGNILSSWHHDTRPKRVITVSLPTGTNIDNSTRVAIQRHLANVWGVQTTHNYQISVRVLGNQKK